MIEFKSKLTPEKIERMQKIYRENSIAKVKGLINFLKIFFIACAVIMFVLAYMEGDEGIESVIICIAIGLFALLMAFGFVPFVRWASKRNQSKINKTSLLLGGQSEETYKFDKDKVFIFTTKGENYRSAIETDYSYFYRVAEFPGYYELSVSSAVSFLLFKDELVSGTLEEFDEILKLHFYENGFHKPEDDNK